ncbi:MAG: penicillin acylase family protein, partial [Bacteroidota bacterium]
MHLTWRSFPLGLLFFNLTVSSTFCQVNPTDITIHRDEWGVPHIMGKTDADAIYGLAWANSEDDFYNLQLNLLMARGRQGEVLGKNGAIVDYATQLLRAREQVESRIATDISPSYRPILEAYVQGINDYAAAHPEEVLLDGVFPVSITDALVGYVMSTAFLSGIAANIVNIFDDAPDAPTPWSLRPDDTRGSNGFAFNSRRTADGQVYFVSNSHQPVEGPTAWYEAHIMSEEGLNCHGALFPGGASIFAGANPNLAWMHTVNFPDLVDVYELEMNPENKLQYRFDGEWKTLEVRKVKLKVKVGPVKIGVKRKAHWSVYGPTLEHKGKFYSFRTPALHTIKAAEQWFTMNKARNYTEFYDALRIGGLPSLNVIYADRRDTLFYASNGLYPVRNSDFDWSRILKGNTSNNRWTEFYPLEEVPQVLCPPSGYVFNMNNTPFNSTGPGDNPRRSDFPMSRHNYQFDNNRSLRFQEMVAEKAQITWDDLLRFKYDDRYPDSVFIYFIANAQDLFDLSEADYPDIAEPIRMLREWDRRGTPDSEAAAIFALTFYRIAERAREAHAYFVNREYPHAEFAVAIRYAKKQLERKFGSYRVPLGELQRLVRGDHDYPVGGLPDQIRTMYCKPWKEGKLRADAGDCYIQFVRFSENGVDMYTTNVFGASNHSESPHYKDQMEKLFLPGKTRHCRLEKEWVREHAVRSYHPGE